MGDDREIFENLEDAMDKYIKTRGLKTEIKMYLCEDENHFAVTKKY